MEELSRKAQALSAVRQQAQPFTPKGTAARHPPCAWGWHRAALGHEPREGPRLEDATLARAAEFGRFPVWPLSDWAVWPLSNTQVQAELHEARAVAQHLRAGESAWQEQKLAAEAAQEEAAALAAREKAEAEAARARAVSELEDLLSYETAARELDRREVA